MQPHRKYVIIYSKINISIRGKKLLKGLPERTDGHRRQNFETIVDAFKFSVETQSKKIAIICGENKATYREYGIVAARVAGFLKTKGINPKDRIVICLSISIDLPMIIFGVLASRAQIIMINPYYKDREITTLIEITEPALIFCDDGSLNALRKIKSLNKSILININGPKSSWQNINSTSLPDDLPRGKDDAMIMFTGGTTGTSKGVPYNHSKIIAAMEIIEDRWPTNLSTEVLLNIPPFFHITGLYHGCFQPVFGCNTLILLPKFHPETVLDNINKLSVSVIIMGAPTAYIALLTHPKLNNTNFTTVKFSGSGGAPLADKIKSEWEERTGIPALEGYGMTEGAPTCNNPLNGKRKSYSAGIPVACTDFKIVDIETGTREMPAGESGEIIIRGPHISDKYYNNEVATKETFRNGWLHTGDIAYLDDDGFVFIIDRLKDMVIVSGFNVFPREIDEILIGHPKVQEAATLGITDDYRGEIIKAFITLHKGENVKEKELIKYCAEKLVKYKIPSVFEFTTNLPKTPVGKIDKRRLKQKL